MVYINSIYTGLIVFPFIAAVYIFFIGVVRLLYPDFDGYSIYGELYSWSFFCVISLVQVLITKGTTIGHAACRMILVSEDGGTASAGQLIKRYLYLWLFTEVPLIIADWLMGERFSFIIDVMIIVLVVLSRVYFIIYFINIVLRKGKPMPHDKLSGTIYMATEIGRGESTVDVSI